MHFIVSVRALCSICITFRFIATAFICQARLKRAELQRDRARAAFVAAKLRKQGKIKSRRYESPLWLVISLSVALFY